MAYRFSGELNKINSNYLVDRNNFNKIDGFFLGLGVIFNDLKGLILFQKILEDNYEKPEKDEISSHAGNYGGATVQIHKLVASTINEFFIFLKIYSDIFDKTEFKEILDKLPIPDKQIWDGLVAAAHGKLLYATDFLKTLVKIRSNIAFHYDHSGKILRNGYISGFFGKVKDSKKEVAYYSIGENIETTRFYFADVAVEEALNIAAGKKLGEYSIGDISLEKYQRQIREIIPIISGTMASLLKNYIQSRRNRPHKVN